MDIRQIRYFTRVAHLRSFSKAAQQLDVAQPALSRQIQALEEELKVQLLLRTTRGVEPTDAGLVMLRMGERILVEIEEMREAVMRASDHPSGELSLGLPPSLCASLAPLLLEDARTAYPDVSLRITEGLSVFLEEWVSLGRIDLAVLTKSGEMEGLSRVKLASEEFALVASSGSLGDLGETITLADAAALELTLTHGFRLVIETALASAGATLDRVKEYDSIPIIEGLLAKGGCVTILPWAHIQQGRYAHQFDVIRIVDPPVRRELILASNPRRPNSAAARAVRDLVAKRVRGLALSPETRVATMPGDTIPACQL